MQLASDTGSILSMHSTQFGEQLTIKHEIFDHIHMKNLSGCRCIYRISDKNAKKREIRRNEFTPKISGNTTSPTTFRCPSASGLSLCARRNTEILALRILAEIDLNLADLHRNTFIELVWSFEQRNPPTRFYSIGGQMLRNFQHVKRLSMGVE